MSNTSPLSQRDVVMELLSAARMAPYADLATSVGAAPIDLYARNLELSSGLHRLVSVGEVILRNALDVELARLAAPHDWLDDAGHLLSDRGNQEVSRARQRLRRDQYPMTHDRIVASVGLGFWTFLLSKGYETTLWVPGLRHAFPHLRPRRRQTAFRGALRMLHLRNRIAHHEKVITRQPEAEAAAILELLSWIDPAAADWAAEICRTDIPGLRLEMPGRAT